MDSNNKRTSTSEDNDADVEMMHEEESKDEDEDEKSAYRDPPEGQVRLRPSCVPFLPSTVFVEYPSELEMKRNDISVTEPLRHRRLCYKSYWERICVRNAFKRAGFEKNNKYWTALWSKHQSDTQLSDLDCLQKVNHFPASWCVGRKDRLSRTMNTMKRLHGKEFDFHPDTFVLPSERDSFIRQVQVEEKSGKEPLWIVKPCASSCGRGISVVNNHQASQLANKNKKQLVQRYLSNPYLIDGKKFDLRIYVLVTGVDPLRVYVHKEGLTRISTCNYSLKNISNRFAHLTNYSVNKKAANFKAASYGTSLQNSELCSSSSSTKETVPASLTNTDSTSETEGFKWSLGAFHKWLSVKEGKDKADKTFEMIHQLCVKTMIAAESEITPNVHRVVSYRTNCYELFGLDIILDDRLNPHLLEVNVSPSLMGSSPLDRKIKGTLIADILHVVGTYPYDVNLMRKYESGMKIESLSPRGTSALSSLRGKSSNQIGSFHNSSDQECHDSDTNTFSNITAANPFGFINLSKLMSNQDMYRKNPCPATIDFASLGDQENNKDILNRSNNCSWWQMILLIEDEVSRSKTSGFKVLYPNKQNGSFYSRLFRNPRFTDHLLIRWFELGGINGRAVNLLPTEIKAYFPNRPCVTAGDSRPASATTKHLPLRPLSAPNSRRRNHSFSSKIPSQDNHPCKALEKKSPQENQFGSDRIEEKSNDNPPRPPANALFRSKMKSESSGIVTHWTEREESETIIMKELARQQQEKETVNRNLSKHYELVRKYQHDLVTFAISRPSSPLVQLLPCNEHQVSLGKSRDAQAAPPTEVLSKIKSTVELQHVCDETEKEVAFASGQRLIPHEDIINLKISNENSRKSVVSSEIRKFSFNFRNGKADLPRKYSEYQYNDSPELIPQPFVGSAARLRQMVEMNKERRDLLQVGDNQKVREIKRQSGSLTMN